MYIMRLAIQFFMFQYALINFFLMQLYNQTVQNKYDYSSCSSGVSVQKLSTVSC